MKYGIFTKARQVEKIVNYLNKFTDIDYVISTDKKEIKLFDFDIGISYCFPYVIDVKKDGRSWYNYHPAPLPEYSGSSNYINAIKDEVKKYGVTLHKMTNEVDKGEIIKKIEFNLDSKPCNVDELGSISHYYLFQLFKATIKSLGDKL